MAWGYGHGNSQNLAIEGKCIRCGMVGDEAEEGSRYQVRKDLDTVL